MYTYTLVEKKYVFGKLEKHEYLLVSDFKALKVLAVNDLTVNQVNHFIESPDTVFYSRSEVADE